MAIIKPVRAANGIAVSYHTALKLEVNFATSTATVLVQSFTDESAMKSGLPAAWNWSLPVEPDIIAGAPDTLSAVEAALTAADATFASGAIVRDEPASLEAMKARAWSRIKLARAKAETGDVVYDGGAYQADRARIGGATQLAWMAKCAGQDYAITWTLADNTTRALDADGMIGLGVALGRQVTQAHDTGRMLRDQIAAATTVEELEAIGWPA